MNTAALEYAKKSGPADSAVLLEKIRIFLGTLYLTAVGSGVAVNVVGGAITGPTGPAVTGPTGPVSTVSGPSGPAVTGPTGPIGLGDSSFNGLVQFPDNLTYTLILSAKTALTINNITVKTDSGTCTLAVTIDGVNVTGLGAISVTNVEQTVNATALNSVAVGQTVAITVSANAAAANLAFSIGIV